MKPLEQQLAELKEQLAGHFDNAAKEQKSLGTVLEKTQSKITALQAQADAIDVKLAERKAAEVPQPGVLEVLQANDSVQPPDEGPRRPRRRHPRRQTRPRTDRAQDHHHVDAPSALRPPASCRSTAFPASRWKPVRR